MVQEATLVGFTGAADGYFLDLDPVSGLGAVPENATVVYGWVMILATRYT